MKKILVFSSSFVVASTLVLATSVAVAEDQNAPPRLERPSQPTRGKGDPERARAWHLDAINAPEAWEYGMGDHDTILALVDSGVDYRHPDLAPNLAWNDAEWPRDGEDSDGNGYVDDVIGWDWIKTGPLPFDRSGHGTFLASIAVAADDNGTGSVGVCPRCALLPVRFLNWEGLGDTEDGIEGLYYAIKRGAKVINFSFAGEGYDRVLAKAIKAAAAADILVVVSASNDGENVDRSITYPAKFNFPNQLTVAASDQNGDLWEGSNWGKQAVHLAAPGVDMLGWWLKEWDGTGEGTSDAAVVVSAAATLLRSIAPELTALQTKAVLMATVKPSASLARKVATGGILDIGAAVRCVKAENLACLGRKK